MKALLPLSWLYGAGVAAARGARLVPRLNHESIPRVISIGNLEAGGNGKTPLAMWWLARASESGTRVAYISRGYGGKSVSSRVVACVPAEGTAPAQVTGLRLLSRRHPDLAREIGDEGALVVDRVPGATAWFCADKQRAIATASLAGAELVILDDAFQSWRVPRHLDVVLLDAREPLDGGHLLPAGRLRETPAALSRADAIVFNGAASEDELRASRERVERWLPAGVPVAGLARRITLIPVHADGKPPSRAVAVSAIARPDAFAQSARSAGVDVTDHLVFADHHRYTGSDVEQIAARARDVDAVVTTEKDWMKLRVLEPAFDVWVARLDVSLVGDPLPE